MKDKTLAVPYIHEIQASMDRIFEWKCVPYKTSSLTPKIIYAEKDIYFQCLKCQHHLSDMCLLYETIACLMFLQKYMVSCMRMVLSDALKNGTILSKFHGE